MAGNLLANNICIEKVKEEIHAIICSIEGSVPSEQIAKDYKIVIGSTLPYRQLGFDKIDDLLISIPDVVQCQSSNGVVSVKAVQQNESVDSSKSVLAQKGAQRRDRLSRSHSPKQTQRSTNRYFDDSVCHSVPVQNIKFCDVWVVQILSIYSGDQVVLRRIDSKENFLWEDMMNDMDQFYSKKEAVLHPVGLLERGIIYASKIDGVWVRVELIAYTENGDVGLKLVDYVKVKTVTPSSVFVLEKKFKNIPSQGIKCHLHGIPLLSNSVITEMECLLNNQFLARVVSREPYISVILYQSPSELNMNEWISNQLAEKSTALPLQVGLVMHKTEISYVSSACDVYMLRETPQKKIIDGLISLLELRVEQSPPSASLSAGNLYLGRSKKHGWCRMRLHNRISTEVRNVSVNLIDFGETELTHGDTLRDLQSLSPILARLPDQAVRVLLARLPPPSSTFTDKATTTMCELTPYGLNLMWRIVEFQKSIPVVELFERIVGSLELVSINAMIEMDNSNYKCDSNHQIKLEIVKETYKIVKKMLQLKEPTDEEIARKIGSLSKEEKILILKSINNSEEIDFQAPQTTNVSSSSDDNIISIFEMQEIDKLIVKHETRVLKENEEKKKKEKETRKQYLAREENKKKQRESVKKYASKDEVKKKRSDRMRQYLSNEEFRQRKRENDMKYLAKEGVREKRREKQKIYFAKKREMKKKATVQ